MPGKIVLHCFRWTPGARERTDAFTVTAGADTTVLDALVEIQRRHDPTLAFRYACRVGMCGSCAMVVNGRERWACRTLLIRSGSRALTVRPLYNCPVIRDLVVDMASFAMKMKAVRGWFVASVDEGAAGGSRPGRQSVDAAIEC